MDLYKRWLHLSITLGILISIHEFGHFWVARKCGVKVLRFSVGFGKPLWTWTDRLGTEYVIALIPLGGYVKMLDEREGPVAEKERHESFNAKPVLSRIAIVAAGPVANFVLALVALWLMYMVGIRTVIPQVGEVVPESPAAVAGLLPGDEIVSVDGVETPGWQQVNIELLSSIGETRRLNIMVRAGEPGQPSSAAVREKNVDIRNWLVASEIPDPVRALGIEPYSLEIPAVLGQVSEDGAASAAGLQAGDKILRTNGESVADWLSWVQLIRQSPGQVLKVELERQGEVLRLDLVPGTRKLSSQVTGYIGAGVQPVDWPDHMVRRLQYNPLTAMPKAAETTWSLTSMTLESLWKMVSGLVSVKKLEWAYYHC